MKNNHKLTLTLRLFILRTELEWKILLRGMVSIPGHQTGPKDSHVDDIWRPQIQLRALTQGLWNDRSVE